MAGEDYELWKRWKPNAIKDAIALYYDVGVGGITDVPEDTTPEMARMWLYNTQKRIDVLIETEKEWKIVELRARASSAALGRIMMYKKLWNDDPPDKRPIKLIIVSDTRDPDVLSTAELMGIEFITV